MKVTKKKSTKVATTTASTVAAASSAASPLPPIGGADVLPTTTAPTPPVVASPVALEPRKGTRVLQGEVDIAVAAANELRTSAVFNQILNSHLGTASQIADALQFAAEWYAQAKTGATWARYTQTQSNLAWNYGLALIERLRASFQAVAATDPSIEKVLPNFTKLLGVRQAVGVKAAVTRRRIRNGELVVTKKAKRQTGTTVSTSATPAPAPVSVSTEPVAAPAAPVALVGTSVPANANGVNGAGH